MRAMVLGERPMGRVLALLIVVTLSSGCNLLGGPSRVKSGELFETGNERYDAYFHEVHELQVSSIGWNDERKASCRPLVDALKLTPEAADVSVVQGAHERVMTAVRDVGPTKLEVAAEEVRFIAATPAKVDEPMRELFRSIETCAHGEVVRAKELRAIPPKVDTVAKSGRDLEPHIREDFAKRGGRAGMTVQEEMTASYEVLGTISKNARNGARAAEDFISDLVRAVDGGNADGRDGDKDSSKEAKPAEPKNGGAKPAVKPSSEPKPKPAVKPKPEPKPAEPKPAETEPKPKPKPAETEPKPKPKPKPVEGEVFNP
jgi:hypothetical protein